MNTNTRIIKFKGTNEHEYTNILIRLFVKIRQKIAAFIRLFVPIRVSACGGMTLIELLVSIAIVVLLLVIGVPAYRHYSYVNDLSQAAQDVKNAILETKNMALAPASDKLPTTPIGGVEYPADSYLFEDRTIYFASSERIGEAGREIKTISLPNNITLSYSEGIQYSIAQQGKIIYPIGGEISITVQSSKSIIPNTKTIIVNRETGQVSIQ